MNDTDRLLHMYADQRSQLDYRRRRENEVFTWTASLLLGFIAAVLLVNATDRPALLLSWPGSLLAASAVSVVTVFSVAWQQKQRGLIAGHQRMLVQVQEGLGCFARDSVAFPDHWREWGSQHESLGERIGQPSKVLATILLGVLALVASATHLFI